MGGRWPYNCRFLASCFQDFLNISRSILVQSASSLFSVRLVSIQVVHPYCSMGTTAAGKKLRFSLSDRSDFHMTDSLSIAVHAFASHVLKSFSVDETLLPRSVNLSNSFREPPFCGEISPFRLKLMYSVLSALTWRAMPPATMTLTQTIYIYIYIYIYIVVCYIHIVGFINA